MYTQTLFENFKKHRLGYFSMYVILLFCLVGIYAPILASSKPLIVNYDGVWYFPLFRYLFFSGFYTKSLDLFFNLLMFTFPLMYLNYILFKNRKKLCLTIFLIILGFQFGLFLYLLLSKPKDPAQNISLSQARREALQDDVKFPSFAFDLNYMTPYKKLNLLLNDKLLKKQNDRLSAYKDVYEVNAMNRLMEMAARDKRGALLRQGVALNDLANFEELKVMGIKEIPEHVLKAKIQIPTLWNTNQENQRQRIEQLTEALGENPNNLSAKASLKYIQDQKNWLNEQGAKFEFLLMPLIRDFHFEDDAGGEQNLNQTLPWWELSRINRKDMLSALIFGVRVSLVVGILAVGLSLLISIPIGSYSGYYGGTFDIITSRLVEVLDAMPTFFMLLMIIAITQSKSIFLVISMIGLFGWTGFSRYIRGEFLKQRNLSYVQSCHALGFSNSYIMFSHILPNAVPPLLTLLPFAMMSAITAEAGLSFLGLGEEGSTSWGVLMDEGRSAFPAESYLLWPPAILLTTLLVAIALVGDALRDAIDPKMR